MSDPARYVIIANPASGKLAHGHGRQFLKIPAAILDAPVTGLDTASADQLAQCAREQADRCDVLVVAGGDGSLSLVINAIDLAATTLAFLPLGTGNAAAHALGYRGNLNQIAIRIRRGNTHTYDLIDCDGRKRAFIASVGIDGTMIRLYEHYRRRGRRGPGAHLRAGLNAYFRAYRPCGGTVAVDGRHRRVDRLLSLMVVKQPFFGLGLKTVPQARWDDGRLHTLTIPAGAASALAGLLTGFTIGNRVGRHRPGRRVSARFDRPLHLQIDGEVGWRSERFLFQVIPGCLKVKH